MEVAQTGQSPEPAPIADDGGPISFDEAVRRYAERGRPKEEETPERAADGKFQKKESAPQERDAAPERAPGEDQSAEPAETPPIEPPRSWNAEQREKWETLPRDVQEYISERESNRETELRRTQNESAEQRKAAEQARLQAEQARHQYEQQTAMSVQLLHSEMLRDFSDIKTHDDVIKLAQTDPMRATEYQARAQAIQVRVAELQQMQQARQQHEQLAFKDWSEKQDQEFSKLFPDYNDEHKAKTRAYLTDKMGLNEAAITQLWNNPLFRDAKTQAMIWDAVRYHDATERAKKAVAQPKPPVQRPGTAPAKPSATAQLEQQMAALEKRFNGTTSVQEQIRIAAEMRTLRRQAAEKG